MLYGKIDDVLQQHLVLLKDLVLVVILIWAVTFQEHTFIALYRLNILFVFLSRMTKRFSHCNLKQVEGVFLGLILQLIVLKELSN